VADAGYADPTEIQARFIPLALKGRDVVARSRTGTGKTCAFVLPALAGLAEVRDAARSQDAGHGPPRVLAVVPTRELAVQVAGEFEHLAHHVPVRVACVYGGKRFSGQVQDLARSAVVVGTPGRLLDHMGRRTFDASTIEVLVLDEVDRMYDLGFREDVDRILRACHNRRQTLLVSATLNEDVEALVGRHLGEHERVEVESRTLTVDEVDQVFYVVVHDRKRELLKAILQERDLQRTLVFVRTKFTADRVAYDLKRSGHDAHEIHSGLPQRRREEILERFRNGGLDLLVATDVAARGLDIEGVDHVINYDIPQNPEDYVHRVGRTARMGRKGWAVTLVTPEDGLFLTAIEKLINREIRQQTHPGFELPPKPGAEATKKAEVATGLPSWCRPVRRRR
jgi:superfamily II DNA/RNA helicase